MKSLRSSFQNQWEIPSGILEVSFSKSRGNWLGELLVIPYGILKEFFTESKGNWTGDLWANLPCGSLTECLSNPIRNLCGIFM